MGAVARIKGVSLLNHLEFVSKTFGENAVEEVLGRVAERSVNSVRQAVAFEWYPLEAVSDLDLAIVEACYQGDITQAWRMGAFSFEKHVTTIYRILMHTLQTSFVFKRAGALTARVVENATIRDHLGLQQNLWALDRVS